MGQINRKNARPKTPWRAKYAVRAVDLFCGIGGLTHRFEEPALMWRSASTSIPRVNTPIPPNNWATFLLKSVVDLKASDLAAAEKDSAVTLLA
jgi:DNA (cytosine-5)-methyltransferase 1